MIRFAGVLLLVTGPEKYNFDDKKFLGYAGRGTSGPDYNYFDDGTIAPYAPLSSLPLLLK